VTHTRRQITHTAAVEKTPRWSAHDTRVTFRQGDSLFRTALPSADGPLIEQLATAEPAAPEPPLTPAQQRLRDEERALFESVRDRSQRRQRDAAAAAKSAVPAIALRDRQSATDMVLSPDSTHVF